MKKTFYWIQSFPIKERSLRIQQWSTCRISWSPIYVFPRPIRLQRGPDSEPRVDQDRTRWALSNGVLIFFSRLSLLEKSPKYCPKDLKKPVHSPKTSSDSSIKGTRVDQDRTRRALSNRLLFFSQDPLTLKYCQKSSNSPKNLSRFVQKGD
jgi:hypothetical protein